MNDLDDIEDRIMKLDRAAELLTAAADLVDEALHMTDLKRRSDILTERIMALCNSDSEESLANLKRELDYSGEEHPGWTRPFASVKNVNRKDI